MKTLLLPLLFLLSATADAQHLFSGKITFERKTNVHQLYEENEWFENAKKDIPKLMIQQFGLRFDSSSSFYEAIKSDNDEKQTWYTPPGTDNRVMQDYISGRLTAQKEVFEKTFRIEDTLPRYTWKISSEVRTIAGFNCRKAVTRICDSVYVVAFYAEDIPVSGGPEQFGGLPGMILQLAVPRLSTTWIATSIQELPTDSKGMALPPSKAKPTTRAALATTIKSSLKDWGKWGERAVWWSML